MRREDAVGVASTARTYERRNAVIVMATRCCERDVTCTLKTNPQVDALAPTAPLCVMGAARNLAFSSHGVFHSDDGARLAIRCVPSTPYLGTDGAAREEA